MTDANKQNAITEALQRLEPRAPHAAAGGP